MIINPKRKEKIKKYIQKYLSESNIEFFEWIEFEKFDIVSGNKIGDCVYITVNSNPQFDRFTNNKISEQVSKFFDVECSLDVFSYTK